MKFRSIRWFALAAVAACPLPGARGQETANPQPLPPRQAQTAEISMPMVPFIPPGGPESPACGTIVYSQAAFDTILFVNSTPGAGTNGWAFDKIQLSSTTPPDVRRVCSIQAAVAATDTTLGNFNVTLRVYSACPNNAGTCDASLLLTEMAFPAALPPGTAWGIDFDFPTPVDVPAFPDTFYVGLHFTGNPSAGVLLNGNPTIGASMDGDFAICDSNGNTANTCALNLAGVTDNFYLVVGANTTAGCTVTPPGGSTPENEPDCGLAGADTVNGGCNSTPNVFLNVACGQTYSGTVGNDGMIRDTDWYQTVVTGAPGSHTTLTWTVEAEFAVTASIATGNCPPTIITATTAPPCTPTALSACVPPGTYSLIVVPDNFAGISCSGPGNVYQAALTCAANCTPAISNDWCVDPDAFINADGLYPFNTVNATTDGPEPSAGCDPSGPGLASNDVWFRYVASCTGTLTAETCNGATNYDTTLIVYDGCDCGNLVELGCNGDTTGCGAPPVGDLGSFLSVPVVANQCYLIRVGSFGGYVDPNANWGSGILTINCSGVTPNCTLPGDANGDTTRDGRDVSAFVTCFLNNDLNGPCACADVDSNTVLDSNDISGLATLLVGLP